MRSGLRKFGTRAVVTSAVLFLLAWSVTAVDAGRPHLMRYDDVKARMDKDFDFARLRTYTWSSGWPAYEPDVNARMVAAIELELAARGLTRLDAGPSDMVVSYDALRRNDVDVNHKLKSRHTLRREYPVGTVTVLLRRPQTLHELYQARIDVPLSEDPVTRDAQIVATVSRLFEKYPKVP